MTEDNAWIMEEFGGCDICGAPPEYIILINRDENGLQQVIAKEVYCDAHYPNGKRDGKWL